VYFQAKISKVSEEKATKSPTKRKNNQKIPCAVLLFPFPVSNPTTEEEYR
jgi:hypothetical protein